MELFRTAGEDVELSVLKKVGPILQSGLFLLFLHFSGLEVLEICVLIIQRTPSEFTSGEYLQVNTSDIFVPSHVMFRLALCVELREKGGTELLCQI